MNVWRISVAVAAAAMFLGAARAEYVISYGSFEDPDVTTSITDCEATGWDFFPVSGYYGGVVDEVWAQWGAGYVPDAPDGTQWLWLDETAGTAGLCHQYIGDCEAPNQDIRFKFCLGMTDHEGPATLRVELTSAGLGWPTIDYEDFDTPASQGSAYHTCTLNTGSTALGSDLRIVLKHASAVGSGWVFVDNFQILYGSPGTVVLIQ